MKRFALAACLAAVSTTGCVSAQHASTPGNVGTPSRYGTLAKQSTPARWHVGARWAFMALDKDGAIAESYVFEVTDVPQQACLGGDWKQLRVVSGDATQLGNPAYDIEGRNLQILLSTAMCDAYPMYTGELSATGFVGKHDFSHLLGGEEYGAVYGMPIDAHP